MGSIYLTWDASSLRRKAGDGGYWLRILLLIVLGMAVARWLSGFEWWRGATYRTYGLLLRTMQSAPTYPSWTAVVLIDDDDYWLGEWARRAPLKRATLAKLLKQINIASPRAIVIDVDLRAHKPDGEVLTHRDYDTETSELFSAIADVAKTTPVVLPKTIGFDEQTDRFVVDVDLFDRLPLGENVVAGYTRVPADLRNLALPTPLNGEEVASLAAAAATLVDPKSVEAARHKGGRDFPFSMFLPATAYSDVTVSARDLLNGNATALRKLKNRVVVIGGSWRRDAYGRGDPVDTHLTPVGSLPGALVHANYIEALLAQRTFSPSYHWIHYLFDVVVGLALAAVFIAGRGAWKVLYLTLLSLVVAIVSLIAFQNLGTIFDAVPPLVLLAGHGAFETIAEWKSGYDAHRFCRFETSRTEISS